MAGGSEQHGGEDGGIHYIALLRSVRLEDVVQHEMHEITNTSSKNTHLRACAEVARRAARTPPSTLPMPMIAPSVQSTLPLKAKTIIAMTVVGTSVAFFTALATDYHTVLI